jgi:hypothetical protein
MANGRGKTTQQILTHEQKDSTGNFYITDGFRPGPAQLESN